MNIARVALIIVIIVKEIIEKNMKTFDTYNIQYDIVRVALLVLRSMAR